MEYLIAEIRTGVLLGMALVFCLDHHSHVRP